MSPNEAILVRQLHCKAVSIVVTVIGQSFRKSEMPFDGHLIVKQPKKHVQYDAMPSGVKVKHRARKDIPR
jgi:hypothetical protein